METYFPANAVFSSRVFWTLLLSLTVSYSCPVSLQTRIDFLLQLLPSLLPSRMTRSLHRSPFVLVLLLPIVAFLVIGRTVEIRKASEIVQPGGDQAEGDGAAVASLATDVLGHLAKRRFGLAGGSSAGAGLSE